MYKLNLSGTKSHVYSTICDLRDSVVFFVMISQAERFSEKNILNMKCGFGFSIKLSSETFLPSGTVQQDIIINVLRPSYKMSKMFISKQALIFSTDFS